MTRDLHLLGKISKSHGRNGTMVLVSDSQLDDLVEELNEVFVSIDGLQTPFPVRDISLLTNTSARIQLEFVNNRSEALEITGRCVYADIVLPDKPLQAEFEQWLDYTVRDHKAGDIGVIRKIVNFNSNVVIQVIDGAKEILLSFYPELVTDVDHENKILYIKAPDGII